MDELASNVTFFGTLSHQAREGVKSEKQFLNERYLINRAMLVKSEKVLRNCEGCQCHYSQDTVLLL